jgi:hypothetical protein
VRAILSDPKTPSSVAGKLRGLINRLGGATDAPPPEAGDFYAHAFAYGSESLRLGDVPRFEVKEAREAAEQIARIAERHEPKEYKLARRIAEIYDDWLGRKPGRKHADGAHYFVEHVDAVLEGGEDGLIPNPDSKYFTPLFVESMRDRGPRDRHVRKLLDLIRRVDEGADLNALYDEKKRRQDEAHAGREAAIIDTPEPKDKTSDEWRIWELRHAEAGMGSEDPAERVEGWGRFWSFFDTYRDTLMGRMDYTPGDVGTAMSLLPTLVISWQREQPKGAKRKARG